MYLENIFIGSEDIRKQLPQESQMFENVHLVFMARMRALHEVHYVCEVHFGHKKSTQDRFNIVGPVNMSAPTHDRLQIQTKNRLYEPF